MVCSLVYMQDLTSIAQSQRRDRAQESLLMANESFAKNIKAPQETIIMLTQELLDSCQEAQRERLQAIFFGTHSIQLHVMNLIAYQHLKYNGFVLD